MATHSSILAWKIPWTEEPSRLQSIGSQESDTTECLSLYRLLYSGWEWWKIVNRRQMIHIRELCSSLLYCFPKISRLTFDA